MSDEGLNEGRSESHSPLHLHELQHDVESRDASAENLAPSTPLRTGSTDASAANKGLVQSIEKRFNRVLHFLTPSSNRQMPGGVLLARDEEPSRVGSFSNLTRFKVCCTSTLIVSYFVHVLCLVTNDLCTLKSRFKHLSI